MTDLGNNMNGGAIAPHETDHLEKHKDKLLDASARPEQRASRTMTGGTPSNLGATLRLRVTEAISWRFLTRIVAIPSA